MDTNTNFIVPVTTLF